MDRTLASILFAVQVKYWDCLNARAWHCCTEGLVYYLKCDLTFVLMTDNPCTSSMLHLQTARIGSEGNQIDCLLIETSIHQSDWEMRLD